MRGFLFQGDGLNFGVLRSYFGSSEGVGRGLGPNGPKWSKDYKNRHFCTFFLGSEITLEFLFGVVRRLLQGNILYTCQVFGSLDERIAKQNTTNHKEN